MNNIAKLAKESSLLTFWEAMDFDLLLTGRNQAPVDMPLLMKKFSSMKSSVTLITIGPNKDESIQTLCVALALDLEEANKIVEDTMAPSFEFTDIDKATALRDRLNAAGAKAQIEFVYEKD